MLNKLTKKNAFPVIGTNSKAISASYQTVDGRKYKMKVMMSKGIGKLSHGQDAELIEKLFDTIIEAAEAESFAKLLISDIPSIEYPGENYSILLEERDMMLCLLDNARKYRNKLIETCAEILVENAKVTKEWPDFVEVVLDEDYVMLEIWSREVINANEEVKGEDSSVLDELSFVGFPEFKNAHRVAWDIDEAHIVVTAQT